MKYKIKTEKKKLSDLNPAPYNPRIMNGDQREGLSTSIDEFGMVELIVWNKRSGNIVGGHQRYYKLKKEGETETLVVVVDLSHKKEIVLNLTLNNEGVKGAFTDDLDSLLRDIQLDLGPLMQDLQLDKLLKKTNQIPPLHEISIEDIPSRPHWIIIRCDDLKQLMLVKKVTDTLKERGIHVEQSD